MQMRAWHPSAAWRGGSSTARLTGSGRGSTISSGRGTQWRTFSIDGAAGEASAKPSTGNGAGGSGGAGRTGGGGGGGSNSSGGGGGGGGGNARGAGLIALYMALLDKHPVPVKLVTTAVLNFAGDLICQLGIEKGPYDPARAAKFTVLGFFLVGPALHFWYLNLSRIIAALGLSGNTAAAASLVLDQGVFAPSFVGLFLVCLQLLDGAPGEIYTKLKANWFDSVVLNWKIWLPFQFLNFRFVPQNYQVLFANIVALAWNVGLSYTSHRTTDDDEEEVKAKYTPLKVSK